MMYLVVYEAASQIVPDNYLTSDSFNGSSLLFRLFIVGIWGKICLYKYISCWLITEGVCIVSGSIIFFLFLSGFVLFLVRCLSLDIKWVNI